MEHARVTELRRTARDSRAMLLDELAHLGVGHVSGCLSVVEALTVLYFDKMNVSPEKPGMEGRDRLVLSKGHAGPALYAVLAKRGFFPREELLTLNRPGTRLPSHCDMRLTPGVDMTAGSLGQGISCAVGMAKAAKIKGESSTVYCMIGDGESQEGQVWEASMAAAQLGLDNLIVLLDQNGMQIDGLVDDVNSLSNPAARWALFGFYTAEVDGHDVAAISGAIDAARSMTGKPGMIVLHTVKGKGISFIEAMGAANHNTTISREQPALALAELAEAKC